MFMHEREALLHGGIRHADSDTAASILSLTKSVIE